MPPERHLHWTLLSQSVGSLACLLLIVFVLDNCTPQPPPAPPTPEPTATATRTPSRKRTRKPPPRRTNTPVSPDGGAPVETAAPPAPGEPTEPPQPSAIDGVHAGDSVSAVTTIMGGPPDRQSDKCHSTAHCVPLMYPYDEAHDTVFCYAGKGSITFRGAGKRMTNGTATVINAVRNDDQSCP